MRVCTRCVCIVSIRLRFHIRLRVEGLEVRWGEMRFQGKIQPPPSLLHDICNCPPLVSPPQHTCADSESSARGRLHRFPASSFRWSFEARGGPLPAGQHLLHTSQTRWADSGDFELYDDGLGSPRQGPFLIVSVLQKPVLAELRSQTSSDGWATRLATPPPRVPRPLSKNRAHTPRLVSGQAQGFQQGCCLCRLLLSAEVAKS